MNVRRIAAEYLYTLESFDPLRNGFVEFDESGEIVSTGISECPESEEVFLEGAVVPGFVNAHCHIELSHLQGKFRKGTGMAGFIDQINELRECAPRDERIACVKMWMERLWSQGVSAMADICNGDDSFQIKSDSPLYTRSFLEVFGTESSDCDKVMASVRNLQDEACRYGIDAAPTPHSCYTMSPELLAAASSDALASGFLSYHSQESPEEEQLLLSASGALFENRKRLGMSTPPVTGKPSLMYFESLLESVHEPPFSEHVLLVHEVCMTGEAADLVNEKFENAFIALCPMSNLFIHDALPPVSLMREKGLRLTVGTDSLSSNDTLDMVRELHCLSKSFPEIPLGELLSWSCINGAMFLSKDDTLGSIVPGKCPGLVHLKNLGREGRLTEESVSERII